MSSSAEFLLGVIALATLVMAIVQVGVLIAAGRMARRVGRLADDFDQQVKPLLGHLESIGKDASRAAALAAVQVERVDLLFADVTKRVDQTMESLQTSILGPAREGRAVMSAVRAALSSIREARELNRRQNRGGDDEDPLFI